MNSDHALDGFHLMEKDPAFKNEKCEMIAETQLFADFDWNDVQVLAGYVQCYEVSTGTVVFKEGEAGNFMCLLVEGEVEILKNDQDGTQRRIVLVTRGKTVGEMSIIDGEPRSATCVASQASVLLLLTKNNYARIIKERPGLAVHILAKLAKLVSQRLRSVSGQLVDYLGSERGSDI